MFRLRRRYVQPLLQSWHARSAADKMPSLQWFSSKSGANDASASLENIRNLGILAHIDAGKTTTTERMLYYAGAIQHMGEVHDGDATMDFMPQERERGITIGSAAISFDWDDQYRLNLIDTPGHVDFTVEVERAVRVLDGAVAIVDGVAGVEAQTETVWRQADRYKVPRIVFVNKLDRDGASFPRSCESIDSRFGVTTLPVQIAVGEEEEFEGLVDLVSMELLRWADDNGDRVQRFPLVQTNAGKMQEIYDRAFEARHSLIEKAADFDDELAELFLMEDEVDADTLHQALRRITISQRNAKAGDRRAVIAMGGSALKNKGVQPLLDAIGLYLPSPLDASPFETQIIATDNKKKSNEEVLAIAKEGRKELQEASVDGPLIALAFKVKHDRQRGLVVFFRVYSGQLSNKVQLINTTRGAKERLTRLMHVAADDTAEVEVVTAGNIGAAVGLKHTFTGDTLISAKSASKEESIVLPAIDIPKPVFTASIEAESSVKQKDLDNALYYLQREDPSFVVSVDEDTDQTLISGMGELHLDIIRERLRADYKLQPAVGAMRVTFLEGILQATGDMEYVHDTFLGAERQFAKVALSLQPTVDHHDDTVDVDRPQMNKVEWENASESSLPHGFRLAIEEGIHAALSRGVLSTNRVTFVNVKVDALACEFDTDSNANAFRAAASLATKEALRNAEPTVLEPLMKLEVHAPDRCVGDVLSDLTSQRRAHIQEVGALGEEGENTVQLGKSVVHANVPLEHMVGYATTLRSKTQGEGTFSMQFLRYIPKS